MGVHFFLDIFLSTVRILDISAVQSQNLYATITNRNSFMSSPISIVNMLLAKHLAINTQIVKIIKTFLHGINIKNMLISAEHSGIVDSICRTLFMICRHLVFKVLM